MAKKENEIKEKKQRNSYFKEMKAELKKVVWPTPKELVNNTIAVIGFVLIIAIIVFIFDFCFDNLNKYGITTLQEKIRSSFVTTDDTEQNKDESTEGEGANESTDNETTEANEGENSEASSEEKQNSEEQNSEANGEENQNNEEQASNEGENSTEEQNN